MTNELRKAANKAHDDAMLARMNGDVKAGREGRKSIAKVLAEKRTNRLRSLWRNQDSAAIGHEKRIERIKAARQSA